jgi:hypothetical protein
MPVKAGQASAAMEGVYSFSFPLLVKSGRQYIINHNFANLEKRFRIQVIIINKNGTNLFI